MKKPVTTNIGGYMCSFEIHPDNHTAQVYVAYKTYTASLEALLDGNPMYDSQDGDHFPSSNTISKIEKWAESLGYFEDQLEKDDE
jgi:hypothetical protein